MKQKKIELIYFLDCPNWSKAKEILNELEMEFTEIVQDNLAQSSAYKNYASPTILIDGKIIYGAESGPDGIGRHL